MIRRTARLRREFIYRKSLEGKERELYEKKRKIRQCLEEGKAIPNELKQDEARLRNELALEDVETAENGASADDEYKNANTRDPKVLVTTSRDPSSRLTQFVKEVKLLMPTAQRVNRGAQVLPDLVELCRSNDFTDLVMVHEHRGEPDGLVVSHMPFGPTAYFGLRCVLTLVPIRPRWRGERRSLRTFPGASLRPPLAFNPRPRRLSTPLLTPFNSTPTSLRMERPSAAR
jgi:U3 small nucleolar ribonucleoprotein protein IMP4